MHRKETNSIAVASKESKKVMNIFLVVLAVLFVGATAFSKFNPLEMLAAQGEFWRFITQDFLPPKFKSWGALWDSITETIAMAVGATGVSAVIAILMAFLGSSSICRLKSINYVVRMVASILRNIPALVWAFILVAAFGIGTETGVIALCVSTVGFLTRSFIETLDEVAGENMEALKSTGAGILPVISQSILPAALPGFIAWFLYCIETNIRASTILGMVGAGGIGLLMNGYIKQYNYHAASTVIIVVAVVIIGVNILTEYLRKITLK